MVFKFVPITSLLNGIPGTGYLSHAINLYLRCRRSWYGKTFCISLRTLITIWWCVSSNFSPNSYFSLAVGAPNPRTSKIGSFCWIVELNHAEALYSEICS
ncbi:hypothetical protein L2E82_15183 [Cichorium intybus]|uniref:Uncharacterized protein n=1 Tax=Cichorium intybus TaxID=13427 RepID=A0ACB9F236_CICIN|nr:hypothetical protein L2E82_15183 [Cichorium intybus]